MKKWECLVCGYIHEGDEPPDECPICGAGPDQFKEVVDEAIEEQAVAEEQVVAEKQEPQKETAVSSKRWKCTICDYIHEGPTPPDECPICKAGPDKFVEIDAEGNEIPGSDGAAAVMAVKELQKKDERPSLFTRMCMKFHLHPISVHTPNGVLPLAVIFLAIAIFFKLQSFETAAYYNMVFVLFTMPIVLLTGYLEWQHRYKGAKTFLFLTKISCSAIVTVCVLILVAWRFIDPTVAHADSQFRLVYLGIAAIMVGAAGIAGHLGGKLVFGTRNRK